MQPYTCNSLVGPTAELYSSRPGAQRTIINLTTTFPLLKLLIDNSECDSPYVDWFVFQSALLGEHWVYDLLGTKFYINTGALWRPVEDGDVKARFLKLARQSFGTLYNSALNLPEDNVVPGRDAIVKGLRACHKHVMTDGYARRFLEAARTQLTDATFHGRIDSDPYLLGTPTGVVDLRTGDLVQDAASAGVSLSVRADFLGVDAPTPDIDSFFASLFDNDQELVDFVQRWLGYCLTGDTKAQKFAIFTGTGSNGKSLLVEVVSHLLNNDYGGRASKFVFFAKSEATNGPTPWLASLEKKRAVFVDESCPQDVINISQLKELTGAAQMQVRQCYREPVTIRITHKQMLATNDIPRLDTAEASIKRRLLIIPFRLQFKAPADFDATNPHHRPMDADLATKLLAPPQQSQLLTWLVRGARLWHSTPDTTFDDKPRAIKDCEGEYIGDTDLLQQFLDAHTVRDAAL